MGASLVAQMVKDLPAMQKTQVQSWSERSPGEGNSYLLQYYCLENPMNRGDWRATVPRVTKSWTHRQINTFTFKEQIIHCGTWGIHYHRGLGFKLCG